MIEPPSRICLKWALYVWNHNTTGSIIHLTANANAMPLALRACMWFECTCTIYVLYLQTYLCVIDGNIGNRKKKISLMCIAFKVNNVFVKYWPFQLHFDSLFVPIKVNFQHLHVIRKVFSLRRTNAEGCDNPLKIGGLFFVCWLLHLCRHRYVSRPPNARTAHYTNILVMLNAAFRTLAMELWVCGFFVAANGTEWRNVSYVRNCTETPNTQTHTHIIFTPRVQHGIARFLSRFHVSWRWWSRCRRQLYYYVVCIHSYRHYKY